ncbi:unnamed protein product, partial [Rotaria magnacalcarata]
TANNLVHKWYKANTGETSVTAFNKRTKTVEEIVVLLEAECQLKNLLFN